MSAWHAARAADRLAERLQCRDLLVERELLAYVSGEEGVLRDADDDKRDRKRSEPAGARDDSRKRFPWREDYAEQAGHHVRVGRNSARTWRHGFGHRLLSAIPAEDSHRCGQQ